MTRAFDALLAGVAALLLVAGARAQEIDHLHFIIPTGVGGGWDTTARGAGRVLRASGLIGSASFENIPGAGGGKGIATLVESAGRAGDALLVNSTPIIVRSLTNLFPYSYRDLTPVARIIGDYQAFVVRPDSGIESFDDALRAFRESRRNLRVCGGSVRGDLDHLAPALALRAAGANPRDLVYVPYNGGGRALTGFLTGEGDMLSVGLGEVLPYHLAGKLRVIAVTAPERVAEYPDIPTLREQGVDFEFVNWRGFFAAPGIAGETADRYAEALRQMLATPEWEDLRRQNGWQNLYLGRRDFERFLDRQETEIRALMLELGFLRGMRP